MQHIPLAAVVASPARIFEDVVINWGTCKMDVRCIPWVFDSETDPDMVLSTVWFAADMIFRGSPVTS